MYYSVIALFIGFLLDLMIGDPSYLWHPIRLIGKLITGTEKLVRRIFPRINSGELAAGFLLVILVVLFCTAIPVLLLHYLYQWNLYVGICVESIMCYQLLATKSLKVESMKVYKALKKEDIKQARTELSMIVGRDTDQLSKEDISKATVETVAENTCDGSIAPMFYMMIGGAGLGFLYKSINTMDSMIGYKNEKYLYIGRFAAKMDDLVNLLPARLSAYLMIFATAIKGYSVKNAWKIYRRDRYNHASPNSAHTEAVAAGALKVRLAGDAYYFGKLCHKKTIGDDLRPIEGEDIKRTNELLYMTAFLGMILFAGLKILLLLISQ